MIPDTVGDCVADAVSLPSGDAQQQTTNGMLVWRKADNWTAFTDGTTTWINGPQGVQSRPSDQRFPWEPPPPTPTPALPTAPTGGSATKDSFGVLYLGSRYHSTEDGLRLAAQAGVGWVRFQVFRQDVHQGPGQFGRWELYDRTVDDLASANVKMLVIL